MDRRRPRPVPNAAACARARRVAARGRVEPSTRWFSAGARARLLAAKPKNRKGSSLSAKAALSRPNLYRAPPALFGRCLPGRRACPTGCGGPDRTGTEPRPAGGSPSSRSGTVPRHPGAARREPGILETWRRAVGPAQLLSGPREPQPGSRPTLFRGLRFEQRPTAVNGHELRGWSHRRLDRTSDTNRPRVALGRHGIGAVAGMAS